jgi:linoleoyl-CoA desaturase
MQRLKFNSASDFFLITLKERVDNYFISSGFKKTANIQMKFKIIFLLTGMFYFYWQMYFFYENYTLILFSAAFFGIFSFLTALNVAHDAAHGAISKNKTNNDICLYTLNLIGVNSYIWKIKHLLAHHTFPNVMGTDSDIGESRIGKLVPTATWKWFCKFQHFYIPLLYLFYSAHWVLFKDFIHFQTLRVPNKDELSHPKKEYVILFIGKMFAFLTTIIFPYFFLNLSILETFGLFGAIHLGPGLLVAFFLVPAHLNSEVEYPVPDKNGQLNTTWAVHQVITTVDFSTNNRLFNFFLGGFNHHVAHHLFPKICHCHYPRLTPIIKQTALEFNIPYKSTNYKYIFISHLKHLKTMGELKLNYDVL